MNGWVILDRDGVINCDSAEYVKSLIEWQPLPGSIEAIGQLCRAGYRVVIATNQSGIGRGLIRSEDLQAIHMELAHQVCRAGGAISGIFYCPHAPSDHCSCRKPRTGLFEAIGHRFNIALQGVAAVGDSLRDLQAASAAGCRPVLVRTGNGRATESQLAAFPPLADTAVYDDLAAFTAALLSRPS